MMNNVKVIQVGSLKKTDWNRQQYRVYSPTGLSPCLNVVGGGGLEPKIMETDKTICLNSKVDGKQPSLEHRIYSAEGCSTAITTGYLPSVAEPQYRIRKLTPRECFRLMGVDDSDIDKIQAAGISNSQQYKLAGNSIVVDVLYYIFRQMFINDKDFEQ